MTRENTDQRLSTFDGIVTDGRRGDLIQRDDCHPPLQLTFLQQLLADLLRFHDNVIQLQRKCRLLSSTMRLLLVFG